MKSNKNLVFLVGTLVFAVVLAAAAILLVRGILGLSGAESDLHVRQTELDGYYAYDPYPSPGNVQREKENGEVLQNWYKALLTMARRGQLQPAERSPSNFMSLLGDRRTQLSQLATSNSVTLSRDFAFGFDRYFAAGSMLPALEDVPRLTVQLLVIDKLCTTLFEERISELLGVEREEFESAAGAPVKRRSTGRPALQGAAVSNAWVIGKGALFGKMHFVIEMRVREKALLAVLNRLAKADLFVVVTGLSIEKEGNDVKAVPKRRREGETTTTDESATNVIPPHAERIISGLEVERPMRVMLDVDVFRFPEGE